MAKNLHIAAMDMDEVPPSEKRKNDDDYIVNPATKRRVLRRGHVGTQLAKVLEHGRSLERPTRNCNIGKCIHSASVHECNTCRPRPLVRCEFCGLVGTTSDVRMHVASRHQGTDSLCDCVEPEHDQAIHVIALELQNVLVASRPPAKSSNAYDLWCACNLHGMEVHDVLYHDRAEELYERARQFMRPRDIEPDSAVSGTNLPSDAWMKIIKRADMDTRMALGKTCKRLHILVNTCTPLESKIAHNLERLFGGNAYGASLALGIFPTPATFATLADALVELGKRANSGLQISPMDADSDWNMHSMHTDSGFVTTRIRVRTMSHTVLAPTTRTLIWLSR